MLGIVTEKADDVSAARKDLRYRVTLFHDKVALFADAGTASTTPSDGEEDSSDDKVARALASDGSCDTQPPLFATPVHIVADAASAESDAALHALLSSVDRCVYRRENVTLVHRGVNADAYLDAVMLALLRCVRPCAEYAMQIVADEVAKERQIQRLLQLEGEKDETAAAAAAAAAATVASAADARDATTCTTTTSARAAPSSQRRRTAQQLPLSAALRDKIGELQVKCGYVGAHGSTCVEVRGTTTAASEPYVVLSDAHSSDLVPPCTRGSRLAPWSFVANAPLRRGPHVLRASLRERNVRSNSYLFAQQRRRSTLALMNELSSAAAAAHAYAHVPLRGNGWGDTVHFFTFNGVSSVMALPGVPHLEDLIRCFAVDFWMRTDLTSCDGRRVLLHVMDGQQPEDVGQQLQISLEGSGGNVMTGADAGEAVPSSTAAVAAASSAATLRVFVRDSTNRVLEALVTLKNIDLTAAGQVFHHVMLTMHSVDEGKLTCMVDGDDLEVRLVQQEHPIAFNAWPHRLFVGGYLDTTGSNGGGGGGGGGNVPACVFRGSILELRFWSMSGTEPQPVVRWPLLVEQDKLCEATHTIAADHHETLLDLQRTTEPAPPCCPLFDGNLVVNVGTMPLWGQLMHNWRIEVRFRTTVATRMMTLMGVTDHKLKMQSFGIVLNAEPVFSKERFRFHELNTTLYVVDAFGACCSALLRGSERQNLVDGQWHTLVWKCVDSEANKFAVTVDGVPQDLLYVTREGATRFVEWSNWVCIGGHNERNWRVRRPFTGQIDRVYVSLRGHHYLTLPLDEGPGAYVVQDRTCHGNHGLLVSPQDGVVRRHDVVWLPSYESGGVVADETASGPVVLHRNNKVSVAAVVFTCDTVVAEGGSPRDVVVDALYEAAQQSQQQEQPHEWRRRTYYTLDTVNAATDDTSAVSGGARGQRKQQQTWYVLPESCYRAVETATQLEGYINTALAAVAKVPGHVMVVIRIGDCHVTLLHLREPPLPADATYDRNMLTWHYRYAMAGTHGWHTRMLRRMVEDVERVLVADTLTPMLVMRRTVADDDGATGLSAATVLRRLREAGRPWLLCAVLHTHLMQAATATAAATAVTGSRLRLLYRVRALLGRDEAAAVALFAHRLYASAQAAAAAVLQRCWRAHRARAAAAQRARARQARQRRLEEIRALRLLPAVQAKTSLYALLVQLRTPVCRAVAPLRGDDTHELAEALRKQGYDVHTLEDVTAAQLIEALTRVPVTTSSCFVHILGYGGTLRLRQPPVRSAVELQLCLHEELCRAALEHDAGRTWRALASQCTSEATALLLTQSRKRGGQHKKKGKKQAAATTRPSRPAATAAAMASEQRGSKASTSTAAAAAAVVAEELAATVDDGGANTTTAVRDTALSLAHNEEQAREDMMHEEMCGWQTLVRVWREVCAETDVYVRNYTRWHQQRRVSLSLRDVARGTCGNVDGVGSGGEEAGDSAAAARGADEVRGPAAFAFVYPCECDRVEPYANTVVSVDVLVDAVMRRRGSMPASASLPTATRTNGDNNSNSSTHATATLGVQCVLAVDLQPLTPSSCGMACLASSLGHVLCTPYKPEQRLLLTWVLRKAFEGHVPRPHSVSKFAILSGILAVAETERDWHSLATYVMGKLHTACDVPPAQRHAVLAYLQRELPFTTELMPLRDVVVSTEQRERLRRDREAQKVTVRLTFGVVSTKVQPDMFALVKSIVPDVPVTEVTFTNVIHVLLAQHNKGIDGLCLDDVVAAVEQCRPHGCAIAFDASITSHGVRFAFAPASGASGEQRAQLTQWLGTIVVRSLSWQLGVRACEGGGVLEVECVEYVYAAKVTCHVRRYRQLLKQWCMQPLPQPYVRFLQCDVVTP